MSKRIQSILMGLLVLGSLTLATGYTHFELAALTGLVLAMLSKGMRRTRS